MVVDLRSFVVYEAVSAAVACPHLAWNRRIEVRSDGEERQEDPVSERSVGEDTRELFAQRPRLKNK